MTTTTTTPGTDQRAGWIHDCGAFRYAPSRPTRCGTCWSALRNRQAHNDNWTPAGSPS